MDFNVLESIAAKAITEQRQKDAIRIYLFMADGDPSLDAGYLAERLAQCYEELGAVPEARYWYGRAVEENPEVRMKSVAARQRLGSEEYNELLRLENG